MHLIVFSLKYRKEQQKYSANRLFKFNGNLYDKNGIFFTGSIISFFYKKKTIKISVFILLVPPNNKKKHKLKATK